MRKLPIIAAGLGLAVLAGGTSITVVGANRQSQFSTRAASLRHQWDVDIASGVPVAAIQPLRQSLQASQYMAPWWSPTWWTNTGGPTIDELTSKTDAAWTAAMASGGANAQVPIAQWDQLAQQFGSFVPTAAASDAATWPAQVRTAATPAALVRLAALWQTEVGIARNQAQLAQHEAQVAALNAEVSGYGGVAGLISEATKAATIARNDNLDAGQVPALTATVQDQFNAGGDPSAAMQQLVNALRSLRDLIALNDHVATLQRPILLSADQASAEGTPNAQTFQSQYGDVSNAFRAASNNAQLTAVQDQMTGIQAAINQELDTHKCGHNVGAGKVITINLTLQEAIYYQDGCVVQASPVTTGFSPLRTPTGNFHVFYKASPFQMISPWPMDSPYYYPPGWVTWVLEFAGGGYFLHDAYWEAPSQYGPGSENTPGAASHGCIHIPTPVMQWLYGWADYGTPVNVTS
jgi:lipoprotein-anchoring transpeptidase ErfK/SrfK